AGGLFVYSAAGHIAVMIITVVGMSFTWPTLEALVSEEEPADGLQHMVGIYNVVWAATAALANFFGGALLDKFGFASLFYVPIAVLVIQLGLTVWLQSQARPLEKTHPQVTDLPKTMDALQEPVPHTTCGVLAVETLSDVATATSLNPSPKAKTFLQMAWVANPFAYIAINTLIAVMP